MKTFDFRDKYILTSWLLASTRAEDDNNVFEEEKCSFELYYLDDLRVSLGVPSIWE